ncbi:hypothetical protein PC9H_005807 [Pleurotus ostreatus]|uniref:Uncharacterized protein n=1 Tax=Pleurotus ostreatus TaxID=5322 RepID=A0A8H6ZZN1_PLEOS|nr:uncharacterized protein PC9H_005807 [Pleurotus ostreatus]KAF7433841.1 hypothetical protein PC9H_005807 [Pleurotus ostreatus]
MPRSRIYHTKAERKAANRAKSARHYAKNKVDILARRHNVRAHLDEDATQALTTQTGPQIASPETDVSWNINRVQQISRELNSFINNSPSAFANIVYMDYIKILETGTDDLTIIEVPLGRIMKWQQQIDKCGNVILQECGAGKEMESLGAVRIIASIAIDYLQDTLCEAMSDPTAMQEAYKRGRLNFQR